MDALRSALQPITHNLPGPVRDIGLSLLGPDCYRTLLLDIDPSSTACIKLAISKGLGIGIIGASSIVKIPQLLKLLNSRSSEGISFLSYLLETSAYLISLAYNARNGFPFSTFGETALIAVQNVAIAALVLHFGGRTAGAAGFVAGLAAAGYALFNGDAVSMKTLSLLQAGAGVLGVASKAPQIWTVWKQGGTGQLSAFAVCSARRAASVICKTKRGANMLYRSSTISWAPSHASSQRCRRFLTHSFCMASLPDSRSMLSLRLRCFITGTARPARPLQLRNSSKSQELGRSP